MTTTPTIPAETSDDAELVAQCRSGDRQAFASIVAKYQTLICSLGYSATGSVTQSEDIAQETFVAAWKQLGQLHDPGRLRGWLCGIARNLAHNLLRRQGREPSAAAGEINDDQPSPLPAPLQQAISREEEAILWRSLQQIPENYRQPLVLFYREGQSVARVAEDLELSEDAVKQRLSRGRKMLSEHVEALVENALRQSTPGRAFTVGVLAVLPVMATSAKAAGIAGTAAKGSMLAKSASLVAISNILLAPLIALVGSFAGIRAALDTTRSPLERKWAIKHMRRGFFAALVFDVLIFAFLLIAITSWENHPRLFAVLGAGLPIGLILVLCGGALLYYHKFPDMRELECQDQAAERAPRFLEYRSRHTLLGLPLIHVRAGAPIGEIPCWAVGWIAIGNRAAGVLFAAGAVSVGAVSIGGFPIGLIAMGGASVGLFATGIVAVGLLAIGAVVVGAIAVGGAAIGILAGGGVATGWVGAVGGIAVAHDFALGGMTLAAHANDPAAQDHLGRFPWLNLGNLDYLNWATVVCWLPVLLVLGLKRWMKKRGFFH